VRVSMKIDIYLSESCGSYHELRGNLQRALADLDISPDVTWHTITYDEAVSNDIKVLLPSGSIEKTPSKGAVRRIA